MYHHIYSACCKKSVKLFTLIAAILFINTSVKAQSRYNPGLYYGDDAAGWAVSFSGGYDVPTGYLATTYKGSPTVAVSVINNLGPFTFNATVGYSSYKPKLDTFYNNTVNVTDGYVKYSNFSAFQLYVGAAYNISITDEVGLYAGLDLGTYLTHFSYVLDNNMGSQYEAKSTAGDSYVAPKLGVKFWLNENVTLGVEAKYNFFFSSSANSGSTFDYGYGNSTSIIKTYSGNLVLTYNF